jgi:hypothetical protein
LYHPTAPAIREQLCMIYFFLGQCIAGCSVGAPLLILTLTILSLHHALGVQGMEPAARTAPAPSRAFPGADTIHAIPFPIFPITNRRLLAPVAAAHRERRPCPPRESRAERNPAFEDALWDHSR